MIRRVLCAGVVVGLLMSPGVARANEPTLIAATRLRDAAALRSLLKRSVDVNVRASDGATALLWAVHHDDREMTTALLQAGADVNLANDHGVTPLLLACA